MSCVVQAIYYFLSLVPGLAARTHRPCGRMGGRLRAIMGAAGSLVMAGGMACAAGAWSGFHQGLFGWFPAILVGIVAAFLLAGGGVALRRAMTNPAPPGAHNVIPFRRPAEYAAPDLHRYRRWEK